MAQEYEKGLALGARHQHTGWSYASDTQSSAAAVQLIRGWQRHRAAIDAGLHGADMPRLRKSDPRPADRSESSILLPLGMVRGGGSKVIYQHVETIARQGVPCCVFHPEKPGSSYSWITHRVRSLEVGHFDPRTDFLVFPEVWAALAARFCIPAGIKYAIFVQNGYLTHRTGGFAFATVAEAYRRAALVLCISRDTQEMVRLLFPCVEPEQMLRVYCSVPEAFSPSLKERLITYMPRKLPAHAERLELYLMNCLPAGWRMTAIDGLSAREVAASLSRSSVFLSLADMEGYALPPLEAALCGNVVVGYTGQAAREYFRRPAFREVPNGDFRLFVSEVRSASRDAANGIHASPPFLSQISELATMHSAANESAHLRSFVSRALHILHAERMTAPAAEPPDEAEIQLSAQ